MKNTNLFIALGAAICLISCNSSTKNNNSNAENAAEVTAEAIAATDEASTPDESPIINLNFKIGDAIPTELDGFTIERQTYMGEEGEEFKYVVKKDDELIAELHASYDFDKDEYTNIISTFEIFSSKYVVEKNLHVGSKVSDVMAAYPGDVSVYLTWQDKIELLVNNVQFYVDTACYAGQLPEVQSIEGVKIENPEFKPDAVVGSIRYWR